MRKSFQGEPSDVELTAVQIQKLQQVGITVTGPSSFEQNFEQRMQELENFVSVFFFRFIPSFTSNQSTTHVFVLSF